MQWHDGAWPCCEGGKCAYDQARPVLQMLLGLHAQVYACSHMQQCTDCGLSTHVYAAIINDLTLSLQWCRYDEVVNYNFTMPGFSPSTGHFTQVVWKSSSQLGCAAQVCADGIKGSKMPSGTLVICRQVTDHNSCGRGVVKAQTCLHSQNFHAMHLWPGCRVAAPTCPA